jgi:hypothetical protein
MDYQVCEADSAGSLQSRVNQLIREKWSPVGGIAVAQSASTSKWWYYQAMIRALPRTSATSKPSPPNYLLE